MPDDVQQFAEKLTSGIHQMGAVVVAFSGGVDSAVVAKAAWLALGTNAVAVTAVSPSVSAADLEVARQVAHEIGIRHIEVRTAEFDRPEYRRNGGNRCYFCKDTLYKEAMLRADHPGVRCILNGANLDDLGDHRPGMQAAAEHAVRSPLIENGLNKLAVRQLARYWQLSVAEKPASPCLASRVAYGIEVTEERVRRIESAESFIRQAIGEPELRVRLEAGELARIEVPLKCLVRLTDESVRKMIVDHLRSVGFRCVTLDLEGFRSGSLNAALSLVQLGVTTDDPNS